MCDVCLKEFKGWCKSFTKTEIYLSLLQVIFLIILIAFLIFLVLHFLVCVRNEHEIEIEITPDSLTDITKSPIDSNSVDQIIGSTQLSIQSSTPSTLGKGIECTWTPSKKTDAVAHYYEGSQVVTGSSPSHEKSALQSHKSVSMNTFLESNSDVDIVDNVRKSFLIALVKIRYRRDILFGCTLTIVSRHWTLSAASCIEAIEEVDALDSFVMMERYGEESQGVTHELSEVIIHPEYRGVNKSYELVAIKSNDVLVKDGSSTVILPTLLDNSLITLGERLGVLGFGKFSREMDTSDRRVHEVAVYKLMRSQCPVADTWAARHLTKGRAAVRGAVGVAPVLCVGRPGARTEAGPTCPCAGAPLIRARTLVGVMSDDGACGLSCRPALYVDLALHRDWLDSVVQDN